MLKLQVNHRLLLELKRGKGKSWDLILIAAFLVFHLPEAFAFKGYKP